MSIPRGIQELGCQGQDVGDDVHAFVTTIQGRQIFVTEWENSGRRAVCRGGLCQSAEKPCRPSQRPLGLSLWVER